MKSLALRSSVVVCGVLLLSACADTERAAVEQYLADMEPVADKMFEMGVQFETLMDTQADITNWTEAEKGELDEVDAALDEISADIDAMDVPTLLTQVHPLIQQSVAEMHSAVDIILSVAENPSMVTLEASDEMTASAESSEKLADQYLAEMEAAITARYPDLLVHE